MSEILLKNVPDDLHSWLRVQAAEKGCGVEEEVLRLIAEAKLDHTPDPMTDPEGFLKAIREDIESTKGTGLTIEDIESAINEGRA